MRHDNVKDLFKQFCKERHAEDKGRNYNMLQEIYANTELFDLSFLPKENAKLSTLVGRNAYSELTKNKTVFYNDFFKNLSIPFEEQFVKIGLARTDINTLFIREHEPFTLTGTLYTISNDHTLNVPFTLRTDIGELSIDIKGDIKYIETAYRKVALSESDKARMLESLIALNIGLIMYTLNALCNLPKHSIVTDTPKHTEYYTRKHGSTIKVCKPIYYVLNKDEEKEKRTYNRIKPLGHLAFDHSFRVRGHWRRISPHTYGKNRQGEYVVEGATFVKEHTRGEGELMKKIRVLK